MKGEQFRQYIFNRVDLFLDEPLLFIANLYHVNHLNIIEEFDSPNFENIVKFIHEYYINRSNKELTIYILHLWFCVLNDRDFKKADMISNYILGEVNEEYEIDVNLFIYFFLNINFFNFFYRSL